MGDILDELSPATRALLAKVNITNFNAQLLTAGGVGAGDVRCGVDDILLARFVQPVINVLPSGKILAPGAGLTGAGVECRPYVINGAIHGLLIFDGTYTNRGPGTVVANALTAQPCNSDGATLPYDGYSATPNAWVPTLDVSFIPGAGPGNLLAAGGGGVKWQIGSMQMHYNAFDALGTPDVGDIRISDSVGVIIKGYNWMGVKQATANTALTVGETVAALAGNRITAKGIGRKVT